MTKLKTLNFKRKINQENYLKVTCQTCLFKKDTMSNLLHKSNKLRQI